MSTKEYIGDELELFRNANNWKAYFSALIAPHLCGRVLEVGAGLGGTTVALAALGASQWVCLEPDPRLHHELIATLDHRTWPCAVESRTGTLSDLPDSEMFDTIIYIDVLEHIFDDRAELALAARHLTPGGKLVVLSPAFPFLFSEFDAAIGHHRRYTKASLLTLTPTGLRPILCRYLDLVGLFASLANLVLLRASLPSPEQIRAWDQFMVPLSRVLDVVVRFTFGRSILVIWSCER